MQSRAEPISVDRYEQGESPRWDGRDNRLIWVDMVNGLLVRGSISAGVLRQESCYRVGQSIGVAAPLENAGEGWICAREGGFVHIDRHGRATSIAENVAAPGTQMNDGACDPAGRFWAGTQSRRRHNDAALFSLEQDGSVLRRLSGVTVSNGIGFSRASEMYYVDTLPDRSLERFEVRDGVLKDRRTIVRVEAGNPDGIAVDLDDCVWVAVWDAGEVRRYDPAGALVDVISLTATRPSAVCLFGSTLIITTARLGLPDPNEDDGRIFAIEVDVAGRPADPWRPDRGMRALLALDGGEAE